MVRRGALAPVPRAAGHGIIFMAASIRVPGVGRRGEAMIRHFMKATLPTGTLLKPSPR